jgi:SAM-dependent methyltransferase
MTSLLKKAYQMLIPQKTRDVVWRLRRNRLAKHFAALSAYSKLRTPKLLTSRYEYKFDLPMIKRTDFGDHHFNVLNGGRPNKAFLSQQLRELGVNVQPYVIDVEHFWKYWRKARYDDEFPNYYGESYREFRVNKALEHFVSLELMQLLPEQVYIDVASSVSVVPAIFSRLKGVKVYRQDLVYPDGLHDDTIGGDAAAMPVPDSFAHAMALHCSFEHFEGDADSRFIIEACRVLKPGGVLCILPLYLLQEYVIRTDPVLAQQGQVEFDNDVLICATPDCNLRHWRMYSAAQFVQRVVKNRGDLDLTVYEVTNNRLISPDTYVDYVAVLRKPV